MRTWLWQGLVSNQGKIPRLDESSARQIWIGWGSGVVCLGVAYLVGGLFFPYLFVFLGTSMALRGHLPGLFAKRIETVGVPYRRKESIKAWIFTIVACLVLAGIASWVHGKVVNISSPGPVQEPVVHIEPERDMVWSTRPGETMGAYTVQLHNTGVSVDVNEIEKKYFLAQRSTSVIIKRLPNEVDAHQGLLERTKSFPVSIDFNPYLDDIKEVRANFREGPSLAGVYIITRYRRVSDGRGFQITKAYGLLAVEWADGKLKGPAIFTEGSAMDTPYPDSMRAGFLTLHEVVPYLNLPERWIPITKEISVGADGKMHIRQH